MALVNQPDVVLAKNKEIYTGNTVTEGAALVGAAGDTVAMPGSANAANFIGFAMQAGTAGSRIDVIVSGIAIGIANEAITTIGTPLTIAATTGYVEAADAADEDVIGIAMSTATAQGDEIKVLIDRCFYRT